MSVDGANPAGLPHVSLGMVEWANKSLPRFNGGGELHSSCDGHASSNRAVIAVAFCSQRADDNFALARVCRYVSRLCSGTASGLSHAPCGSSLFCFGCAALRVTVSLQILFGKNAEKISPEPPQMQSFGTWEHGPLALLVPRSRSGDSTNGDNHVPISYVELGRFCQRDLPRCPWPSSARRRRCNDELAADERPGRRARSANHAVEENRIMKSNQLICEIRWDRVPLVADQKDARAWLGFQACRGLALNTLDAYGRNLERYLRFLSACGKKPHEIGQETVGAYLRDLVKPSATSEEPDIRMANATIQQHLAALRMFYDFLVEEERCTRNPYRQGEGRSSRPLVKREHKLPTIPTEEEWCRVLGETAKEPIRNRLMLAMSYDAGLRREELCLLETGDIDPSRRTIRIRAETTKNRRSRVLPYSVTTDELYGQYLEHRRTLSRQRGRLFLSQSPRNRAQPVSIWAWSKIVAVIAKRAGATGFTPHTLRHLCLTDLARADWDIH